MVARVLASWARTPSITNIHSTTCTEDIVVLFGIDRDNRFLVSPNQDSVHSSQFDSSVQGGSVNDILNVIKSGSEALKLCVSFV